MNTHLKQLWAAMKLPKNFKKSYKFFCLGLDIRVTEIVNADTLHACRLCPSVHLVMKIAFRHRKDTVFLLQSVKHTEIFFHFLTQKLRHFNRAVALFRFRRSNHILPFQTLIGFIDCDCFLIKVEICRSQS